MSAKCLAAASAMLLFIGGKVFAEEVRGVIAKVDPDKKLLVLEGKNRGFKGLVLHLKLRDDTEVMVGRKPAKIGDLVPGKRARVLFETQGTERVAIRISVAGSLSSADSPSPPPTIAKKLPSEGSPVAGTLRRISLTDREIVVISPGRARNSETETTFLVPDNVKVVRNQRAIRFEDLREGEQVSVSGANQDGKLVAQTIEVQR
jgi:hypothetical protein